MKQDKNDEILISSLYLFYDLDKTKLVATKNVNYNGIPFIICPQPKSSSERYAYQMYPTNNLYYIISNGGVELNVGQILAINKIKEKFVGNDSYDRIGNEKFATLTKQEIDALITSIDAHISKHQLKIIAEKSIDNLDILPF